MTSGARPRPRFPRHTVPADVKFYLDENVDRAVAVGLRRRGVDILTAEEAGMRGAPDEAQIAFALEAGRVIITNDAHFPKGHASGVRHAGIAYCHQSKPVGRIIQGIMVINDILDQEAMRDCLEYL